MIRNTKKLFEKCADKDATDTSLEQIMISINKQSDNIEDLDSK